MCHSLAGRDEFPIRTRHRPRLRHERPNIRLLHVERYDRSPALEHEIDRRIHGLDEAGPGDRIEPFTLDRRIGRMAANQDVGRTGTAFEVLAHLAANANPLLGIGQPGFKRRRAALLNPGRHQRRRQPGR